MATSIRRGSTHTATYDPYGDKRDRQCKAEADKVVASMKKFLEGKIARAQARGERISGSVTISKPELYCNAKAIEEYMAKVKSHRA